MVGGSDQVPNGFDIMPAPLCQRIDRIGQIADNRAGVFQQGFPYALGHVSKYGTGRVLVQNFHGEK